MMASLSTTGGNDVVDTPDALALAIVRDLQPGGNILEPCHGGGAFVRALQRYNNEAEPIQPIQRIYCMDTAPRDGGPTGNFLTDAPALPYFDWIITNPPWSEFRAFLNQAMKQAGNVVFLDKFNAWGMKARLADMAAAGFYFRRFALVNQPPKPWPQMGLALAATWISREAGYHGAGPPGQMPKFGSPEIYPLDWTPEPQTLPAPSFLAPEPHPAT